jgi:hypothetical protein
MIKKILIASKIFDAIHEIINQIIVTNGIKLESISLSPPFYLPKTQTDE